MTHAKGTYLGGVNSIASLRARCHVDEVTGCWLWRQHTTKHGLAMVSLASSTGRTKSLGRRAALDLSSRKQPTPDHVAYAIESCFEPSCCNPMHARWGTRTERMRQASARGAFNSPERIARLKRLSQQLSKLTPAQRVEAATSTGDCKEIAARLGVSPGRIAQLRRGGEKRLAASVFEWRP